MAPGLSSNAGATGLRYHYSFHDPWPRRIVNPVKRPIGQSHYPPRKDSNMAPLRLILLALTLITLSVAQAETATRYIRPGASVEVRTGLSKKDKTLKSLDPGTAVTVLKLNPKLGYAQVRLETGENGWIVSRALSTENPATKSGANTEAAAAAEAPSKSPEQLQAEVKRLETELIAVHQASANILRIQAERDQLEESVIELKKQLDTALRDKHALNDDQKQAWFLIGGAVLLAGILLGVLLPKLSLTRRNQWNSF